MTGARLLLVSGSTRAASTNTAALRAIAGGLSATAVTVDWAPPLAELPAFDPDLDAPGRLPTPAGALRDALDAADAVMFCTPEYAGTLPGAFKNLLDWAVGGTGLHATPVAWVNVAAPGRGTGATATLATVLGYLDARIVHAACRDVPVDRSMLGADGTLADRAAATALVAAAQQLLEAARSVG